MKTIILTLLLTLSSSALASMTDIRVHGIITSFDKKTISLKNVLGNTILIPRKMVATPKTGAEVSVLLTEQQYNELVQLNP